jgi:hypothetical protein
MLLALVCAGCVNTGYGSYNTEQIQAKRDAALEGIKYLSESLAQIEAATEAAKAMHPEDAAAIDAKVRPSILQLQAGIATFQAALSRPDSKNASLGWSVARAAVSSAVQVLAPMAISAIARGR